MHRVLYIQEVLFHIFSYCSVPLFPWSKRVLDQRAYANAHLASLARTCKIFKEPALDLIWEQLKDLTPLARLLDHSEVNEEGEYSLKEYPTPTEWDIILGYTRRVRALPRLCGSLGLTEDCIEKLSNPPTSTTDSLFPNLLVVGLQEPSPTITPIVRHLANPRLKDLQFMSPEKLGPLIESFPESCPNLTDISVYRVTDSVSISSLICRWKNLRVVECPRVCFDDDAFVHLSSLRHLHLLRLETRNSVGDPIHASEFPTSTLFTLQALREIGLFSRLLSSVSSFLRRSCLPVVDSIHINIDIPPTAPDLGSFFSAVQESCSHNFLTQLVIEALFPDENQPVYITFDLLRPFTCFVNIQSIQLDIHCGADLNETELLALASSWPQMTAFNVASDYGWIPSSAITPGGFLKLLEKWRSLRQISVMMDTHGYTEIPQGHPWHGLSMPEHSSINLLNSPIEEESVHPLAVFFHATPFTHCELTSNWDHPDFLRTQHSSLEFCNLNYDRWRRVFLLAREHQRERWALRKSLESGLRSATCAAT